MNQIVGRVVVHLDLFQDDVLLLTQLLRIECRMEKHVGEHVEGQWDVPVDHLGVVARRLFVGERVEISANAVHGLRNLSRASTLRSLEEHVLDEVRNAAPIACLHGGTDVCPDADRRRPNGRHRLG